MLALRHYVLLDTRHPRNDDMNSTVFCFLCWLAFTFKGFSYMFDVIIGNKAGKNVLRMVVSFVIGFTAMGMVMKDCM